MKETSMRLFKLLSYMLPTFFGVSFDYIYTMTCAIPSMLFFTSIRFGCKQIYLSNYLWLFLTVAGMISDFYKKVPAVIIKVRDSIAAR